MCEPVTCPNKDPSAKMCSLDLLLRVNGRSHECTVIVNKLNLCCFVYLICLLFYFLCRTDNCHWKGPEVDRVNAEKKFPTPKEVISEKA